MPTDTRLKQYIDGFLPRTGLPFVAYFGVVVVALGLAPLLPRRGQLGLDGVVAMVAGGWCALNFWRCRHVHCLVSSVGWLGLSLLCFVEAFLGRSVIAGDEQLVFLGVLALALAFEGGWVVTHGTNMVRLRPESRSGRV